MTLVFCSFSHPFRWVQQALEDYSISIKKLNQPFELQLLKFKNKDSLKSEDYQKAQASQLLKFLRSKDLVLLMDEGGQSLNTSQFSGRLRSCIESGKNRVVLVVGGSYGVSKELKQRADYVWKLSNLTLNGGVAQILTLEQVYRAVSLWKGSSYHH